MCDATQLPMVLESYLDDLEGDTERLLSEDNEFIRDQRAKEALEGGDLGIVYQRMQELSEDGGDVRSLGARTLFIDGLLAMAVRAPGCLDKDLGQRWGQRAVAALEKSVEQMKTPCALYDLAIAYAWVGRTGDALATFEEVAKMSAGPMSIEAAKEAGRLAAGHGIRSRVVWTWTPPATEP